ncbi:MAG: NUDIX domain-containing protein [Fibrobacter sp.]|jgi:isopentenyl-diphosphate delta-isomerase|nr:NUDIX domain-containing protein [Fibrobacter sp.]
MLEFFDVINPDGTSAGYSLPRDEVHKKGLWHRTVHIWILNFNKELLIQKRSLQKEVYPGLWDISCAGHLSSGEDCCTGAIRELKEELGLTVEPGELKYLFTVTQHYESPDKLFIDNELTDVLLLNKDVVIDAMRIDKNEVAEVKFISIDELQKSVMERSPLLAPHEDEYKRLFETLLVN